MPAYCTSLSSGAVSPLATRRRASSVTNADLGNAKPFLCGGVRVHRRPTVMVSAAPAASVGIDSAFAEAASGEWEGHRVYFDGSGAKLTVPERFLPPAFTEWGVEVFDWQSQCAMKVTAEGGMYAKELRFLPTQGCEADASTVESAQERTIAAADVSPALATASVARGSYSCGSRSLGDGGGGEVAVVEHCLRFDFEGKGSGGSDDGPKRARVRVQQTIETQPGSAADAHPDGGVASCAARCDSAWLEFYYEEFKNGASLCASCGGPNKWGESPATDPDDLTVGRETRLAIELGLENCNLRSQPINPKP